MVVVRRTRNVDDLVRTPRMERVRWAGARHGVEVPASRHPGRRGSMTFPGGRARCCEGDTFARFRRM